jgi:hypothetical protein
MIYVIQSEGKGANRADKIKFLIFNQRTEANEFILNNEMKYSDGNKYWTRLNLLEQNETIELNYE